MPLLFSIAPIVLLIWMMTKRNGVPSYLALPLTAAVVYALQLWWFDASPRLLHANIITALVSTLTPITIIAGAILLNKLMQVSGAENVVRRWLETVSPNPVAQLMIIGWAFAFMIEGASGFGTPAAIAAPILVGLGFNPLRVALLTLVMNSVPVSFGAVGTLVRLRQSRPVGRQPAGDRPANRADPRCRRLRHSSAGAALYRFLAGYPPQPAVHLAQRAELHRPLSAAGPDEL